MFVAQACFHGGRLCRFQPGVGGGGDGNVVGGRYPGDGEEGEDEVAVAGVETEAIGVCGFGRDGGGEGLEG